MLQVPYMKEDTTVAVASAGCFSLPLSKISFAKTKVGFSSLPKIISDSDSEFFQSKRLMCLLPLLGFCKMSAAYGYQLKLVFVFPYCVYFKWYFVLLN